MNRDRPSAAMAVPRVYGAESDTLVTMLEHLHDALLVRGGVPALEADLDALESYARMEFGREEAALHGYDVSALAVHRREHQQMLAKLNTIRRGMHADTWNDFDRGHLYDLLSEWLVHALWER